MKIGLDLDGTLYGYPDFFREFVPLMAAAGHQLYCTSAHGRDIWEQDAKRLNELGIDANLISPELLNPTSHTDLRIKGKIADQVDMVFDDDPRVQLFTQTPVFCPPNPDRSGYHFVTVNT